MAQRVYQRVSEAELQADARLCELVAAGDPEAQKEFYERYSRLSHYFGKIATEEYDTGVADEDDLSQDAMMYMLDQARKYDATKKMRFSSFFSVYIIDNLRRKADDQQYAVRIPQGTRDLIRSILGMNRTLANDNQPVLTDDDISKEFNIPLSPNTTKKMSVEEIRQGITLTRHMGSTDFIVKNAESTSDSDYSLEGIHEFESLTTQTPLTVEEEVERLDLLDAINEILDTLTDQEASVIRMQFGIDDGQLKTPEEISQHHNLPKETIRQIESRAMRKLRRPELSEKLRDYLAA